MRKKKILIGLTTAFLALTALASCGSSKSGGESKSSSSVVENSSESSKDEQKSSSEQNQGQGEESSSEQNQGQGTGAGQTGTAADAGEAVIEGETYKYGFGADLTSWQYLPDTAGTKEVTDSKGIVTTVLASNVTVDAFTFKANDKARVDDGSVYVSQKAEITIVLKTKGKIHAEGNWGSTSNAGKIYVKNGSTAVYTSQQYTASTENVIDFETTVLDAGTYVISSDASVKYTKLYYEREYKTVTVTYNTQYGSVAPAKIEKGDSVQLPELYAEGQVFEGWFTSLDSTGTKITENTKFDTDTNIYAKWKVYDPNDYVTISFNTGVSGIEMQNQVVEKNSTFMPESLSFDGYQFGGWFTDSEYKYAYNGVASSTTTLFAKFTKIHTVTYKYEDGTVITSEKVLDKESVASVPTTNTIVGKRFVGWTLNDSDFNTESAITSDIVLVAKYETIEVTGQVAVMNSAAYQEGLYAEFMQYDTATEYNAYVSADGTNYTKLDSQLIRKYKSGDDYYYRVDAVGLKAGSYTLKIAPVIEGTELPDAQALVKNLNATAHDRSGFGFVNGTSSGAYNDDGTLKSNAVVLYITENTKNTVSLDVVTNSKGATTNAVGLQNILNQYKKCYDTRPLCIRLIGQITDFTTMEGGDILIKGNGATERISCGITFEGIGKDATCDGWGLRLANASNVEVRNLGFMNCDSSEKDDCGLQQSNDHIWVHNCDFFYGHAGSDGDQAKGDGALDTKTSTYITHSYNHFWDTGKSNLQGMKSESTENYITYHHNWYDHSDSRHPRIRTCTVHIYNNYYDGNAKYGIGVTMGASAFVENNYFRNCKYPMLTSLQGSDVHGGGTEYNEDYGTFSSEAGGVIKSYGNVMVGTYTYIAYGADTYINKGIETTYDLLVKTDTSTTQVAASSTEHYDAYEASSRDEIISSSITALKGGTTYNNFDTAANMYSYTVQSAEDAKNTVIQYAGRVQGGDFKWTFDNSVDDTSSEVNTALKTALLNYKTSLVQVQGESSSSQSGGDTPVTPTDDTTVDDVIALITALPDPTSVVEADRTQIMAAKSAYDSLSESDKQLVTNSSKLTNCINALPAQSTFTIDYVTTTVTTGTNNVTIYDDNDILITATKIASQDASGIKFNGNQSFTIKNNSSTTKTFVLTVVGNDKSGKSFTCDGTTYNLTKTSSTITIVLEPNQSKTVSTSTGGAYLTSITVS